MDGHHGLKRALLMFTFLGLYLVQAQDQQGFISLDCGLPPNQSPYIEPKTKLNFSSDADFIQSGKRGRIVSELKYVYQQYNTLRYFPDGTRNCYNLRVNQGINYLIRAGFVYGNYDGLDRHPKFDIYVGANLWTSVDADNVHDKEIIHMAKSNSLQICLVKTETSTPFIYTLELRPLRNDSYSTQSGSLQLVSRKHSKQDNYVNLRYPDDVYDRQWDISYIEPKSELESLREINTTLTVNSSNPFEIPKVIARSAGTPKKASDSLRIYASADHPSDNIVIYFHFAEIQNLQSNDTREFNIIFDGNIINSAYSPKKLQIETIFNTPPKKCDFECVIDLEMTGKSTLPPLLNAYEVYKVMEFPYSETYPADVAAIKNIQAAYRLNIISWEGDPCLPEQWKWKGVECNYTTKSTPPRIISLDLSSKALSGIIVPGFQNLTQLQRLCLLGRHN